jgi:hypothetical protein
VDPGPLSQYAGGKLPEAKRPSDYGDVLFIPRECAQEFYFYVEAGHSTFQAWLEDMVFLVHPETDWQLVELFIRQVRKLIFTSINLGMIDTAANCMLVLAEISSGRAWARTSRMGRIECIETALRLVMCADNLARIAESADTLALSKAVREKVVSNPAPWELPEDL